MPILSASVKCPNSEHPLYLVLSIEVLETFPHNFEKSHWAARGVGEVCDPSKADWRINWATFSKFWAGVQQLALDRKLLDFDLLYWYSDMHFRQSLF